jgi:hypothetical protein
VAVFLNDVLSHRPEGRDRYADAIRQAEAAGAPYVPGIWRLFAYRPAIAEALSRLAQEVLRGPSPLAPGFRELIAAFVSSRNRCLF